MDTESRSPYLVEWDGEPADLLHYGWFAYYTEQGAEKYAKALAMGGGRAIVYERRPTGGYYPTREYRHIGRDERGRHLFDVTERGE